MIFEVVRFAVFGFAVLTVAYFLISIYSRSVRREKLEKRWDADQMQGDRDAYIEAGMQAYKHGLRRRLLILVYVIPIVVGAITAYIVNYQ